MVGQLALDDEQAIVSQTRQWLEKAAQQIEAYRVYLEHWGDWPNPWRPGGEAEASP